MVRGASCCGRGKLLAAGARKQGILFRPAPRCPLLPPAPIWGYFPSCLIGGMILKNIKLQTRGTLRLLCKSLCASPNFGHHHSFTKVFTSCQNYSELNKHFHLYFLKMKILKKLNHKHSPSVTHFFPLEIMRC